MRVLFVSLVPGLWGGSEVLWSAAARVGVARGWTVGAFFPYFKTPSEIVSLHEAGVEVFYGTPPPTRWWRRIGYGAQSPVDRFRDCLRTFDPEFIVFTQGAARDGLAQMKLCAGERRHYAVVNQAVEPLLHDDLVWHSLRSALLGAARLWCVSNENLEALRAYLCEPLPQAEVIPNAYGCAFDVVCPWPPESEPLRLAVVGRLEPEQKGQDLVLDLLAQPQWRSRPLHVTFFGLGSSAELLRRRATALDLSHVAFSGQQPVASIWRTHHALLLPSRFEGQSLAMIEAMLHGRPVIASPVGGTRAVVRSGETGYLATEPGSIAALSECMEQAWGDRANWIHRGSLAQQRIREHIHRDPGADLADRIQALCRSPRQPLATQ